MKKTIAILLADCLALAATATVYAADIRGDSDPQAGNTQVTFQVDPTYTVTIPATITLEKQTAQDGTVTYENDLTITANNPVYAGTYSDTVTFNIQNIY